MSVPVWDTSSEFCWFSGAPFRDMSNGASAHGAVALFASFLGQCLIEGRDRDWTAVVVASGAAVPVADEPRPAGGGAPDGYWVQVEAGPADAFPVLHVVGVRVALDSDGRHGDTSLVLSSGLMSQSLVTRGAAGAGLTASRLGRAGQPGGAFQVLDRVL